MHFAFTPFKEKKNKKLNHIYRVQNYSTAAIYYFTLYFILYIYTYAVDNATSASNYSKDLYFHLYQTFNRFETMCKN